MTTDTASEQAPFRAAAIGVGARVGLALHVKEVGGTVVAAVDPDPRTHERAARLFGDIPVFASVAELLASGIEIDGAFITTPDFTHAEVAIELLEAGVPSYIEKPLAISIEDADRILETAYRTGTKVYVGHNMRHMQVVRMMKDIVDRGEIGEVKAIWCRHFVGHGADFYFKDWHADRARTTGLLLQKGAHDIDVIHWLAGASTRRVTAMGALTLFGSGERSGRDDQRATEVAEPELWPPQAHSRLHPTIDVEDLSMALFELENGVLASYEQCHYTPDYWRSYTVIGTHGRLENVGDMDDGEIHVWNRRHAGFAAPDEIHGFTGGVSDHGGADEALVDEFIRYARDGGPTQTSPIAARDAVAAGEAATFCLRAGGVPQDVPPAPATLRAALEGNRER
ncbi:MAG: Gfo/Idh/MocA family oxidoreductase [Microbacterium sp.]|nr:Gfo/Idh/MocA family oxidoreductase [Microbacterium sp.]